MAENRSIEEVYNELLCKNIKIPKKELKRLNNEEWYHGTSIESAENIKKIGVLANYNLGSQLDFGMGFYLTDTYERAKNYISRVPTLNEEGVFTIPKEWAIIKFKVNPFKILFEVSNDYKFKNFAKHDEEFAKFCFQNRLNNVYNENPHAYDVIWGVMSDSLPNQLIADYKNKKITYDDVVLQLQKPNSMKQLYIRNQEICNMLEIADVIIKKEEQ